MEGVYMRLWHYTVMQHLPAILKDRKILLATAFVPPGVKATVWFSTNPVWEQTARKGIVGPNGKRRSGTKEETHRLGGGLVRIEVTPEAAPYTWRDYKRMSGEKEWVWRGLEEVAKEQYANPSEWRCSFEPVLIEKWISVEVWDWEEQRWEDFFQVVSERKLRARESRAEKERS
jgi:hypothetical protein